MLAFLSNSSPLSGKLKHKKTQNWHWHKKEPPSLPTPYFGPAKQVFCMGFLHTKLESHVVVTFCQPKRYILEAATKNDLYSANK